VSQYIVDGLLAQIKLLRQGECVETFIHARS
jgi:hypothetical protein